ncbi:hypothetical protein [Enterococcus pallens]|uniref:Uncharacterized protein n=1 Tax=Enterococcus pallens ATCC BAA-351 TaxID=1158607 RepID=R2QE69_9ENTE|nr:hypothetical protein [Enterococcus pallens]EOH94787.1 hypothetical protein UAU_01709 [Enterococcus pallens ATCC BAA-351]EOU14894.1 hypothetical protein I588_04544 [Enterococcus pallens ATCC BAA-351]OJG78153.1 hypothetical protein RV10_GL001641 [Enterococcus pallens]
MEVVNYDAKGNRIEDISKITLPIEESAFVLQMLLDSKNIESSKSREVGMQ